MGKKIRNSKGVKHEIHRTTNDSSSVGKIEGGDQTDSKKGSGGDSRCREWFSSLLPKVERDFSKDGKIEWHGKIYKMVDGKFVGYYLPMIPDEQKLSVQIATIKKKALEVKADAVAAVYYVVKMERQDEGLKNQEHVELLYETEGFNRKYTWDICRVAGKLPWLENGREDSNYEGGRLLE